MKKNVRSYKGASVTVVIYSEERIDEGVSLLKAIQLLRSERSYKFKGLM